MIYMLATFFGSIDNLSTDGWTTSIPTLYPFPFSLESSEEEWTFDENTETLNSFPDSDENLEVKPEENRFKTDDQKAKDSS